LLSDDSITFKAESFFLFKKLFKKAKTHLDPQNKKAGKNSCKDKEQKTCKIQICRER
jgi:hypothetical protein